MIDGGNPLNPPRKQKLPRLVGGFIRERREALGISQRALGQLFSPTVTTQFISNVERGVTPLPPSHVPTLAQALGVSETEMMAVLEREYALRLSGRIGREGNGLVTGIETQGLGHLILSSTEDYQLMHTIYEAYKKASDDTRRSFLELCHSILKIPRSANSGGSNKAPV